MKKSNLAKPGSWGCYARQRMACPFLLGRDSVWNSYLELAKVQVGEREQPTIASFLAELPAVIGP